MLDWAVTMTLKDEPLDDSDQSESESFDKETRFRLRKERLKMQFRQQYLAGPRRKESEEETDDFIPVDNDGNFDLDHDNPGPVLKSETQQIMLGYIALKQKANIDILRKKWDKFSKAFVSGSAPERNLSGLEDAEYESSSSEVSQDRCRVSPYYPACGPDCWLKTSAGVRPDEELPAPPADSLPPPSNIYRRLNAGETRMLILQPGSGQETVVCQLEAMAIPGISTEAESKAPGKAFEALSYAWGSPTRTHVITCNEKPFAVTTSLFHALSYLRHPDRIRGLWIDAICINQDDVAERNEQVRHMLAIYQAASRVVVWLGLAGDHGALAVAAMNFLHSGENRRAIMRKDHDPECLKQLERVISVLKTFLRRPWFSRCWIRQEVSAARIVTVQCGSYRTTWNAMKRTVNCMWKLRYKLRCQGVAQASVDSRQDDAMDSSSQEGDEKTGDQLPLRYLKRHWVLGQSLRADMGDIRSVWFYQTGGLLDLLMVSRLFDATDPRDKVYSVVGLAQAPVTAATASGGAHESEGTADGTMRIDYSATVSQVYQHVAKFLVNRDRTLDILCIVSAHRDDRDDEHSYSRDLPSWTPDWRVPPSILPVNTNWEFYTHKYGAAGFSHCLPQSDADHGKLIVEGFAVTRLAQLLPITPTSVPHPPEAPTGTAVAFDPNVHFRRFAMTAAGKAAFVPRRAEEGDLVFVLLGCRLPVVLKIQDVEMINGQKSVTAVVVGPCFIGGIMYGEAMRDFESGKSEKLRIVLV